MSVGKTETLSMRVAAELKQLLKLAAAQEQRTQTNLLERLLVGIVEKQSLLRHTQQSRNAYAKIVSTNMIASTPYSGQIAAEPRDYREKGSKEASKHRPPTNAPGMDHNETELLSKADKWLNTSQTLFDAALGQASHAVVDLEQKVIELDTGISQLVNDTSLDSTIEAEMSTDRRMLVAATVQRMQTEVDYRRFRDINNITDQAVYPESHIFHLAIIAGLALLETGINAFFYENNQGLLGGFTVALGIAVMTVSAGCWAPGFRFKNLAAIDKKVLGWLCLVAFLALSIFLNTLFATFRAEYQLLTEPNDIVQLRQAFSQAWGPAGRVFLLEVHFADMMSFVLFGLGLLLSGLAFWKGYTIDDKYPGHGQKDRAVKEALAAEIQQQERLREKVRDILHRRRDDLQAVSHEPMQLIGSASGRSGELKRAQQLLDSHSRSIQRDFALVLEAYRAANRAVRAAPAPPHFADIPDLMAKVSVTGADAVMADFGKVQVKKSPRCATLRRTKLDNELNGLQANAATVLTRTFSEFISVEQAKSVRTG